MRFASAAIFFVFSLLAVDVVASPVPGLKQFKPARRDELKRQTDAKPSKVWEARAPAPSKRAPGPSAALGARAPGPSKRAPKPSAALIARAHEFTD
ncbi:uncharacterized protein STEHIDRAFT_154089 [Stereum hirsutum FP-91666 SS1]|uniref:uncharacterized protein n=1 Tax=Stereum hirsutum (strain FP-91666) TaxID=721885 RepID=UPI000440CCC6|nr:uncharacterized protein STEHIDRAFT_154089 [Stereum hirsutum FP-91666 SS1]EIM90259.1 hypothetical protein STEHIDRAFT_154089 [Stereum hirsutum FP-91666 SS1]